jgi:hypothetical protein
VQARTARFLAGLSEDELRFIAEFQGCRILEPAELDDWIERFPRTRTRRSKPALADFEQKMILLLEYLRRAGAAEPAPHPTQIY